MDSKTLSAPLIRKNMTRHWLLFLAICVYFFIFIFVKIQDLAFYKELCTGTPGMLNTDKFHNRLQNKMFSGTLGILELCFATLAALCAFSYLHNKKEEQFYRSLPVKTEGLFLSSLLSGFLFYAVPWLVATVISAPIAYFVGDCKGFVLGTYVSGMIFRLGLFIISYSIAVLGAVLSGRRFFALLLTYLLHALFPALESIFYLLLENNLLGISSEPTYFTDMFSPFIGMMNRIDDMSLTSVAKIPWGALGIYTTVSFLLMWLTGFLHRKREAEDGEKTLVFSSLLAWFQILLTLFLSYTIASFLAGTELILSYDSPLAFPCLILSPVAFFLGRMLLLRTKKVFQAKAFLQWGIFASCFLLLILVFQYDLLYIVRRVPNPNSVKELTITINGMPFTTDNPVDIRDFTDIHRQIIDSEVALSDHEVNGYYNTAIPRDEETADPPTYYSLSYRLDITYDLGDRTMERSYNLEPSEQEVKDIWESLENYFRKGTRAKRQIVRLYQNIDHISVSDPYWEMKPDTLDGPRYTLSTKQINVLYDALLKDAHKGTSLMIPYGDLYGVTIYVSLKNGDYFYTYLNYWGHENARSVIDSILATYETAP